MPAFLAPSFDPPSLEPPSLVALVADPSREADAGRAVGFVLNEAEETVRGPLAAAGVDEVLDVALPGGGVAVARGMPIEGGAVEDGLLGRGEGVGAALSQVSKKSLAGSLAGVEV